MNTTDKNYLQKLFIEEAKPALSRHSGGGGASDPVAEAVMAAMALSTSTILGSWNSYPANGMFTCSGSATAAPIGIIPDNIVEIKRYSGLISQLYYSANKFPIILSLPKIPPIAGDESLVVGSTDHKPKVIYVPDGSVDAYKTANNWSEFADLIKPISAMPTKIEFYIKCGGYTYTYYAMSDMTWADFLYSDYSDGRIMDMPRGLLWDEAYFLYDAPGVQTAYQDVIKAGHTYVAE
jgi:hypothetical protein